MKSVDFLFEMIYNYNVCRATHGEVAELAEGARLEIVFTP